MSPEGMNLADLPAAEYTAVADAVRAAVVARTAAAAAAAYAAGCEQVRRRPIPNPQSPIPNPQSPIPNPHQYNK